MNNNGKYSVVNTQQKEEKLFLLCNKTKRFLILLLELQETWFDLWLSIFQRGGGQRGVGWQVRHRGRHLRDAACQLLPGQQGRGRRAVAT